MDFTSKLPHVGTTIFTTMSKLASETGALNLSQGFPNFDCSPELSSLVTKYLHNHNQYAPMAGVLKLRERISEKTFKTNAVNYNPESEITITSGASEALYVAIATVVNPGDEVIIFEPAYDSYLPAIEMNGGKAVYISLEPPGFHIDWDLVKQKVNDRTKLMIINTPHNPTGFIWTEHDLDALAEIIKNHSIFVVSDEVYEHIVFDGQVHLSVCSHPLLKERAFICNSFGKTFHITGWKVGYCLAPVALTTEFRKIHQYLTFSVVSPMQYALADYLENENHYQLLPAFYNQKRDLFLAGIRSSEFTFQPAAGSFFQVLSYKNITDEHDYDLAVRLTYEIGVASVPFSAFYHQKSDYKLLRFCFAKDDETLVEAGKRLSKL